jgi:hypothetical protein
VITVTRADVIAAGREWIGTPFVHQGRVKGVGVDCVGLAIGIAEDLGILTHDEALALPRDYRPLPDHLHMRDLLNKHMEAVWPPSAAEWVWLSVGVRMPTHLAMLTDNERMIHACSIQGSVVERRFKKSMHRVAKGAFRYKEVNFLG